MKTIQKHRKFIVDTMLGILLTIGTVIMVVIIGTVKVVEWIGQQSSNLYYQHPCITITAITCLVSYFFIGLIAYVVGY